MNILSKVIYLFQKLGRQTDGSWALMDKIGNIKLYKTTSDDGTVRSLKEEESLFYNTWSNFDRILNLPGLFLIN